jgi:hypothetical protein
MGETSNTQTFWAGPINIMGEMSQLMLIFKVKGTVRRKLRWVKSGINRKLFLYCLAADIFNFYLKGQYSVKSIKPVSAFNDYKN